MWAAVREGLDVSITHEAPIPAACRHAASTSALPAPQPRQAASTTTSSIHALRPEGTSYHASDNTPMIPPCSSAQKRAAAGETNIRRNSSAVGTGSVADNCGISRANASVNRSSIEATWYTFIRIHLCYRKVRQKSAIRAFSVFFGRRLLSNSEKIIYLSKQKAESTGPRSCVRPYSGY